MINLRFSYGTTEVEEPLTCLDLLDAAICNRKVGVRRK
jgi:hypothetical protein